MKKMVFLFILFLSSISLLAQEKRYLFCRSAVYTDNDYFLEWLGLRDLDDDRNYTMGIGFYFANNSMGRSAIFKPLHFINKLFHHHDINDSGNMHSLLLGNGSFTPEDLQQSLPIRNDRPYGAVTAIQTAVTGFAYKSSGPDLRHIKTASFSAGIIGTRLSETVQTFIHKKMNNGNTEPPFNPEGWPNQISETWEPTLLYQVQHDFLINKNLVSTRKGPAVQAKWGYRYSLGYFTGLNGLFQFRAGWLNKLAWFNDVNNLQAFNHLSLKNTINKKNDEDAKTIFKGLDPGDLKPETTFEFYLFGSSRPVFVLYNALLNGQFRKSVYTLNFQSTRHVLLEFDGGLGLTIPICHKTKSIESRLRVSGRSPEFKFPNRSPRWHYWAGFEIVYNAIK